MKIGDKVTVYSSIDEDEVFTIVGIYEHTDSDYIEYQLDNGSFVPSELCQFYNQTIKDKIRDFSLKYDFPISGHKL